MYNSKSNRRLALVNIFILVLIFLDAFILHPKRQLEIFDRYETKETLSPETGTRDHLTNFIHAKSGHKFREPSESKNTLNSGDTFYIERSIILNRPIILLYRTSDSIKSVKCGTLNQGYFGITIVLFIFIISIINVFPKVIIHRPNLNERLLFCGTAFLIVSILLYFF